MRHLLRQFQRGQPEYYGVVVPDEPTVPGECFFLTLETGDYLLLETLDKIELYCNAVAPSTCSFLLLETGDKLLLETGDRIELYCDVVVPSYLLLETGDFLLLETSDKIQLES